MRERKVGIGREGREGEGGGGRREAHAQATGQEAMGRQMLAVFAMCGMYITNVHPAYHEKLALQLQEDLIREEEEKNLKAQAKKAKQAEKKKKQQGVCYVLRV